MKFQIYFFLHIIGVLGMAGVSFFGLAHVVPERKRVLSILGGVLALVALVCGFGMLAVTGQGFPTWAVVKLLCWLGISALGPISFRKPALAPRLAAICAAMLAVAVAMAVFKPF